MGTAVFWKGACFAFLIMNSTSLCLSGLCWNNFYVQTHMYLICHPIIGGYSKVMFEVLIGDIKQAFHSLIAIAEQRLGNPKGTIKIDLNF